MVRNFDWELVIVDDNSPDNTQEVAKKLIDIYGKSRIILKTRPQKLGLGLNLNFINILLPNDEELHICMALSIVREISLSLWTLIFLTM